MGTHLSSLITWFAERPDWLQDAMARLVRNGRATKGDLQDWVALCKAEVGLVDPSKRELKPLRVSGGFLKAGVKSEALRIIEISEPRGINALAPRKPLKLGDGPLAVVYGGTGAGKSGYVRGLKHASGARAPGALLGNVFSEAKEEPSCKFTCSINGVSREFTWKASAGPVEEMRAIQVYDNDSAAVYVDEENEVAFEPQVLHLFTTLVNICGAVSQELDREIQSNPSKLPIVPTEFSGTAAAAWYGALRPTTTPEEVSSRCAWPPESEAALVELNKRLLEEKPAQKARALRSLKTHVSGLRDALIARREKLSDARCSSYLAARSDAHTKRIAATVDANKIFSDAPLSGVGSASWKLLWEQARRYSEEHAYPGVSFPNVGPDSRCVLCQQALDPTAKDRFVSFEAFVRGELESQAIAAEKHLSDLTEALGAISEAELELRIESAGITDPDERHTLLSFQQALSARESVLVDSTSMPTIESLPLIPSPDPLNFLADRATDLEQQALLYDSDASDDNRPVLEAQRREFRAAKWLAQQVAAVEAELVRLKLTQKLERAKRLTNTQQLSLKKSNLADELITSAYISRFQRELDTLGAAHIRVALAKTRAERGHVFHEIQLKGCKKPASPSEVLSEGEFRIVSLAAFLADVEGRDDNGPFVFDDPITSLDQPFEEAMASRLIDLGFHRQVVVFTHRLSLLELLVEKAAKRHLKQEVISLRGATWGIGDPDETFEHYRNPAGGLRYLLQRIPKARVAFEQSSAEYEIQAKALCSHFRILLERLVEKNLLSEVLIRFRRSVQTQGRIQNLAKIRPADCSFIDDLMTKYSKYEHSQPTEAPVPLPPPDELERDFKRTEEWLEEFTARAPY